MFTLIFKIFLKHLKPKKHKYKQGIVGLDGKSWTQTKDSN